MNPIHSIHDIYKENDEDIKNDEDIDISKEELINIVYTLRDEIKIIKKNMFEMKTEIDDLKKQNTRQSKHKKSKKTITTICKELNSSMKRMPFNSWLNTIKINTEHLNTFFKLEFEDFIHQLISEQYRNAECTFPFTSYTISTNTNKLFLYTGEWGIIKNEQLDQLISFVQRGLLEEFLEWETKLGDDRKKSVNIDIILKTNFKLMCIDIHKLSKSLKKYIITLI